MDFDGGIAMSAHSITAKVSCFVLNLLQFQLLIGRDSWDSFSLIMPSLFSGEEWVKSFVLVLVTIIV